MRSTHVATATGRATPAQDADLFVADLFGAPAPGAVTDEAVPTDAGATVTAPAPPPAAVVQVLPSVQVVTPAGTPFPQARWAVHQRDTVFEGALDARGSTGALGRPGDLFRDHRLCGEHARLLVGRAGRDPALVPRAAGLPGS